VEHSTVLDEPGGEQVAVPPRHRLGFSELLDRIPESPAELLLGVAVAPHCPPDPPLGAVGPEARSGTARGDAPRVLVSCTRNQLSAPSASASPWVARMAPTSRRSTSGRAETRITGVP
jgi:hypothetical protein